MGSQFSGGRSSRRSIVRCVSRQPQPTQRFPSLTLKRPEAEENGGEEEHRAPPPPPETALFSACRQSEHHYYYYSNSGAHIPKEREHQRKKVAESASPVRRGSEPLMHTSARALKWRWHCFSCLPKHVMSGDLQYRPIDCLSQIMSAVCLTHFLSPSLPLCWVLLSNQVLVNSSSAFHYLSPYWHSRSPGAQVPKCSSPSALFHLTRQSHLPCLSLSDLPTSGLVTDWLLRLLAVLGAS